MTAPFCAPDVRGLRPDGSIQQQGYGMIESGVGEWEPAGRQPMKTFLTFAAAAAAMLLATQSEAASFSCREPTTAAERTVCSHAELNALDDRLSYWYDRAQLRARTFDLTEWLTSRQRAWLEERNRCGADVLCLRGKYQSRIRRLKDYAEHV